MRIPTNDYFDLLLKLLYKTPFTFAENQLLAPMAPKNKESVTAWLWFLLSYDAKEVFGCEMHQKRW